MGAAHASINVRFLDDEIKVPNNDHDCLIAMIPYNCSFQLTLFSLDFLLVDAY